MKVTKWGLAEQRVGPRVARPTRTQGASALARTATTRNLTRRKERHMGRHARRADNIWSRACRVWYRLRHDDLEPEAIRRAPTMLAALLLALSAGAPGTGNLRPATSVDHTGRPRIDSDSAERPRHLRRRRQRHRSRWRGWSRRCRQRTRPRRPARFSMPSRRSRRGRSACSINTSADLDHVGGNAIVGGAGIGLSPDPFGDGNHATVLAHENVLLRLSALGTQWSRISLSDQDAAERYVHVAISLDVRQ